MKLLQFREAFVIYNNKLLVCKNAYEAALARNNL